MDDHRVVARSLKAYLESFEDLEVTGIASSGEELLEHLGEWQPQIVLQDLLLAAVRAVARGKTYIDPAVARSVLTAAEPQEELTPREREVLRQLALGRANKEIAGTLSIGEETVKTHVASILAKLAVENRAQAIVQALKRGLVSLEELE